MEQAQAAEEPDVGLAYLLATASYCAYAINEQDGDLGQARALSCLRAAAQSDRRHLGALGVKAEDVEAYFDPARPEDAYLLIRTRKDVIVAFRGTTPPPILPGDEAPTPSGGDRWGTFFADFFNNLDARVNARGRHAGFEDAWLALKAHLFSACGGARAAECSKFDAYARRGRKVYFTGHSKGGALATLAGLDFLSEQGTRSPPIIYAFAAPKAVSAEFAAGATDATSDWWRFERERDLVPSLPPDDSVLLWRLVLGAPYAALGNLVYFPEQAPPQIAPASAASSPPDAERIPSFLAHQFFSVGANWSNPDFPRRILNINETACRALIDVHFRVLADVRDMAHRRTPTRAAADAREEESFFATGLFDRKGQRILWGYRDWCEELEIAP